MTKLGLVDPPLRISGAPSSLRAPLVHHDSLGAPADIRLIGLTSATGQPVTARSLTVVGSQMRLRLDPLTPPGHYAGSVEVAGVARPIEIDVIETVALSVRPDPVVLNLSLGPQQRIVFTVENRGNVVLTIDLTGEYPLGEEIPLASDRDPVDAPLERLSNLFARIVAPRVRFALRDAGVVTVAMADGVGVVPPGTAQTISAQVTLPDNLSPVSRYRALIPIYTADLELVAITAMKQAMPTEQPPPRKRGVST